MTPSLTPVIAMLMGHARFTPIQTNTTGVPGAYTFYSATPTHATPSRANDDVQGNISYTINNNTSNGGKAEN